MEIHDVSFHLSDGRKRSEEGESSGYWWIEYSRVIIPLCWFFPGAWWYVTKSHLTPWRDGEHIWVFMVLQRTWLEHQTGRELGAGLLHRWQKSSPGITCRMWQPSTGYIPLQNVLAVQLFCHVWLFVTLWTAACQASLSFTISLSLPKIRATELVMLSKHLTLCRPLLLLPSIFPSIRVFSSELALCIRWPKYWSFSFSISTSNEYSGLISFRIDWFDFFAVQGTLKSLL